MTDILFNPITLGDIALANRVIMAPMTRDRAGPADEPTASMDEQLEEYVIRQLHGWLVGRTLIVVTHDQALGARAHRQIRMVDGGIESDVINSEIATNDAPEAARSPSTS